MKTTIRILGVFATLIWIIAAARVWADAHDPYTTGLCTLIAAAFATYTLTQPRKKNRNEPPHKS